MWLIALASASAALAQPPVAPAPQPAYTIQSAFTTGRLATVCEGPLTDLREGQCLGYVLGVFDSLSLHRAICPTEGGATEQAVAVVRKALKDHPEHWDLHPARFVDVALSDAFPCK